MKARKFFPLLVIAAGMLAYYNSFTGAFVFDDLWAIHDNPTIRHLWPIWRCLSPPHRGGLTVEGRPLINLSLAINYALGGYHVWGYHALNLTIHILAGLTLLGIVRRTLLTPTLVSGFGAAANELALAVAILWTIHPLQTESVTYIIQRAESIMGLLYLLTLYCFIRGTESHVPRLWYGLSVAACALGMASKEVMVTAPVMVMLYDRAFVSGTFRETWRRRRPLYLALAGTWIVLGCLAVSAGSFGFTAANARLIHLTRWGYFLTEPGVILHYLRLSVWPHPLCLDYYGWPVARTWMSVLPPALVMAILLGATAGAWRANSTPLRTRQAWGFLGTWFFLILAPSSSVIPLDCPASEHRMYLPLAAVIVLGVIGVYALAPTSKSGLAGRRSATVLAVLAVGLGFLTWQRNQDYRSEFTIWRDTVVKCPNNPRAHDSFGLILQRAGRLKDAIDQFEQALRIKPDLVEAHYDLGVAMWADGDYPGAIRHSEEALQIRPDYAEAHNSLGAVLARVGRLEDAVGHYEQALRLQPDFIEAHNNLASALWQLGKVPEAIEHWKQALRLKPDYAEAHNNFGAALVQAGKIDDAIGHYEQALQINPNMAGTHNNLGVALEQVGRVQEAIGHYEQALRLNPDYAAAQKNLARLRAAQ